MFKIHYKDLIIEVIHNKKLKHTYVSLSTNKTIIIKTANISQHYLDTILLEREDWMRKKLHKVQNSKTYDFKSQENVVIFGNTYDLDDSIAHQLKKSLQMMRIPCEKNIFKCYDNFYKKISIEYITQRVDYFASLMQLEYHSIKYRKMKRRWGSCSSIKVLTFNISLIKIEKDLIDYVVVHELAHLVHMNHSKKFHMLVEKYLAHSKLLRARLQQIHLCY